MGDPLYHAEGDTIYRGYRISRDPKPIPDRRFDWDWWHTEYDWAPDGPDPRAGFSASLEAAKADIDAQIDDTQADAIVKAFEPLSKLARQP